MAAYTPTTPGKRSGVTAPLRREILAAGCFTGLAGIAVVAFAKPDAAPNAVHLPTHHPDAALLALCAEHARASQASEDIVAHLGNIYSADLPEEAFEQEGVVFAVEIGLQHEIAAIPSNTRAGVAAKASVLQRQLGYTRIPAPTSQHELVWSLTADLLRGVV